MDSRRGICPTAISPSLLTPEPMAPKAAAPKGRLDKKAGQESISDDEQKIKNTIAEVTCPWPVTVKAMLCLSEVTVLALPHVIVLNPPCIPPLQL